MLFENFDSFAGPRGERLINCLFFMVDLCPENSRIQDGFDSRVKENIDFLNVFALQSLFYLSYSKSNLQNVALFINKLDLLPVEENFNPEQRALELYSPLIELIKRFCEAKKVPLSIKACSALNGLNVRALYTEIIRNCLDSTNGDSHE